MTNFQHSLTTGSKLINQSTIWFSKFLTVGLLASFALTAVAVGQDESQQDDNAYGGYSLEELRDVGFYELIETAVHVDVEVDHGTTIADFINLITEQSPAHLNIVVLDNARDVTLPSMYLKNVTVAAALNAMRVATNEQVYFEIDDSSELGYIKIDDSIVAVSDVNVFNLDLVLSTYDHEQFLSAVEIGLEMMGKSKADVQMKLHEETHILFVKGNDEAVNMIDGLIGELGGERKLAGGIGDPRLQLLLPNGAQNSGGPAGPGPSNFNPSDNPNFGPGGPVNNK